ncbi:MAG: recombinase family protein [Proteobacteria bacterium]|nr:recombinase family protein [Pseudomonadota bacterium]
MLIGYARVSTQSQNLDRQIAALNTAGCTKIFSEKASGKSVHNRPELEKALSALPSGGTLVIAEWDRATRSMLDGIAIMTRVHRMDAAVKVLDRPYLDLTTPIGKGILALLSALAEDERHRIVNRAAEGRRIAKAQGRSLGRRRLLTPEQQTEALNALAAGESARAIARRYRVHHNTITRLKSQA